MSEASEISKPETSNTIGVKLRTDALTDTIVKDTEKNVNLLLVAIPLSTPKLMALGFLWQVMNNLTNFYAHAEAAANAPKNGIVRGTFADAAKLGKKLFS